MKNQNQSLPNPQMNPKRQEMLDLMEQLFGRYEGDYRVNFLDTTQKEMAEELGYDPTDLNRYINPTDSKKSNHSYERLIKRLKLSIENRQLKNQFKEAKVAKNKNKIIKFLIPVSLLFSALFGWLIGSTKNQKQQPIITKSISVLNDNQLKAFLGLYEKNIQNEIIIEAIFYNEDDKKGMHHNAPINYANTMRNETIVGIIKANRDRVKDMGFKAKNGQLLINIIETLADNELEKNFELLKPHITNNSISARSLAGQTRDIINNAQMDFREALNHTDNQTLGFNASPPNKENNINNNCRLNEQQTKAVMKLYAKTSELEMTLEGILFHYSKHKALDLKDTTNHYNMDDLYKNILLMQETNREILSSTKLKAPDGSDLETLATNTAQHNLKQEFLNLVPYLTNPEMHPDHLIKHIRKEVERVQRTNLKAMKLQYKANLAKSIN